MKHSGSRLWEMEIQSTEVNLTHWGRITHICVSNLTVTGSDNGLSPGRRQAIIWTNAGILLIGPLGTNFSEILIEILTFSFKKMRLKVSSAKRRPFCLGLNGVKIIWEVEIKELKYLGGNGWFSIFCHIKNKNMAITVKPLIKVAPNPETWMFLVSPCSCLCSIHWSQVLS